MNAIQAWMKVRGEMVSAMDYNTYYNTRRVGLEEAITKVDKVINRIRDIGFHSSILVDAIESRAVGSWAGVRNYEWKDQDGDTGYIIASAQLVPDDPEYVKAPMQEMFRDEVDYIGNHIREKRVIVDHTMIRRGLNKVLSGEVEAADWIVKACRHAKEELDGSFMDAVCANVVIQAAVFEENIYG